MRNFMHTHAGCCDRRERIAKFLKANPNMFHYEVARRFNVGAIHGQRRRPQIRAVQACAQVWAPVIGGNSGADPLGIADLQGGRGKVSFVETAGSWPGRQGRHQIDGLGAWQGQAETREECLGNSDRGFAEAGTF